MYTFHGIRLVKMVAKTISTKAIFFSLHLNIETNNRQICMAAQQNWIHQISETWREKKGILDKMYKKNQSKNINSTNLWWFIFFIFLFHSWCVITLSVLCLLYNSTLFSVLKKSQQKQTEKWSFEHIAILCNQFSVLFCFVWFFFASLLSLENCKQKYCHK